MSKILIIGHSVLDKIYYKNTWQEKPGGIFHAVNALVNLGKDKDEFFLATQLSENSYKYFASIYDKINLEYSVNIDEITTVTLRLFDDKERDEQYSNVTQKITLPHEIDFNLFDIILVNMISGFDLSHIDLAKIKEKAKCEIYFDIHTLSRGFDENGNRIFRKIDELEKWLQNIDILQMNENEMETLWNESSESKNVEKLLGCGIHKVIITKGNKGVSLYDNGMEYYSPPIDIDAQNFVGCGDSFGAAFCYDYSKNKNLNSAVDFANLVAGIITSYKIQEDFKRLKDDITKRKN